ncbi:hypothetical protein M2403_003179 [Rahnella sp. BIGb0603]|nr:hypothetical protein [Rahnella sp. BIGb0603]
MNKNFCYPLVILSHWVYFRQSPWLRPFLKEQIIRSLIYTKEAVQCRLTVRMNSQIHSELASKMQCKGPLFLPESMRKPNRDAADPVVTPSHLLIYVPDGPYLHHSLLMMQAMRSQKP